MRPSELSSEGLNIADQAFPAKRGEGRQTGSKFFRNLLPAVDRNMENRYNRDKIFCSKRKAREMNKFHTTFLGYRIYRRKFSSTIAVVLFLSILVFAGMLIFFVNTWMTDLRQQAQNRFLDRESRMAVRT